VFQIPADQGQILHFLPGKQDQYNHRQGQAAILFLFVEAQVAVSRPQEVHLAILHQAGAALPRMEEDHSPRLEVPPQAHQAEDHRAEDHQAEAGQEEEGNISNK
jgi:hypothetical protein